MTKVSGVPPLFDPVWFSLADHRQIIDLLSDHPDFLPTIDSLSNQSESIISITSQEILNQPLSRVISKSSPFFSKSNIPLSIWNHFTSILHYLYSLSHTESQKTVENGSTTAIHQHTIHQREPAFSSMFSHIRSDHHEPSTRLTSSTLPDNSFQEIASLSSLVSIPTVIADQPLAATNHTLATVWSDNSTIMLAKPLPTIPSYTLQAMRNNGDIFLTLEELSRRSKLPPTCGKYSQFQLISRNLFGSMIILHPMVALARPRSSIPSPSNTLAKITNTHTSHNVVKMCPFSSNPFESHAICSRSLSQPVDMQPYDREPVLQKSASTVRTQLHDLSKLVLSASFPALSSASFSFPIALTQLSTFKSNHAVNRSHPATQGHRVEIPCSLDSSHFQNTSLRCFDNIHASSAINDLAALPNHHPVDNFAGAVHSPVTPSIAPLAAVQPQDLSPHQLPPHSQMTHSDISSDAHINPSPITLYLLSQLTPNISYAKYLALAQNITRLSLIDQILFFAPLMFPFSARLLIILFLELLIIVITMCIIIRYFQTMQKYLDTAQNILTDLKMQWNDISRMLFDPNENNHYLWNTSPFTDPSDYIIICVRWFAQLDYSQYSIEPVSTIISVCLFMISRIYHSIRRLYRIFGISSFRSASRGCFITCSLLYHIVLFSFILMLTITTFSMIISSSVTYWISSSLLHFISTSKSIVSSTSTNAELLTHSLVSHITQDTMINHDSIIPIAASESHLSPFSFLILQSALLYSTPLQETFPRILPVSTQPHAFHEISKATQSLIFYLISVIEYASSTPITAIGLVISIISCVIISFIVCFCAIYLCVYSLAFPHMLTQWVSLLPISHTKAPSPTNVPSSAQSPPQNDSAVHKPSPPSPSLPLSEPSTTPISTPHDHTPTANVSKPSPCSPSTALPPSPPSPLASVASSPSLEPIEPREDPAPLSPLPDILLPPSRPIGSQHPFVSQLLSPLRSPQPASCVTSVDFDPVSLEPVFSSPQNSSGVAATMSSRPLYVFPFSPLTISTASGLSSNLARKNLPDILPWTSPRLSTQYATAGDSEQETAVSVNHSVNSTVFQHRIRRHQVAEPHSRRSSSVAPLSHRKQRQHDSHKTTTTDDDAPKDREPSLFPSMLSPIQSGPSDPTARDCLSVATLTSSLSSHMTTGSSSIRPNHQPSIPLLHPQLPRMDELDTCGDDPSTTKMRSSSTSTSPFNSSMQSIDLTSSHLDGEMLSEITPKTNTMKRQPPNLTHNMSLESSIDMITTLTTTTATPNMASVDFANRHHSKSTSRSHNRLESPLLDSLPLPQPFYDGLSSHQSHIAPESSIDVTTRPANHAAASAAAAQSCHNYFISPDHISLHCFSPALGLNRSFSPINHAQSKSTVPQPTFPDVDMSEEITAGPLPTTPQMSQPQDAEISPHSTSQSSFRRGQPLVHSPHFLQSMRNMYKMYVHWQQLASPRIVLSAMNASFSRHLHLLSSGSSSSSSSRSVSPVQSSAAAAAAAVSPPTSSKTAASTSRHHRRPPQRPQRRHMSSIPGSQQSHQRTTTHNHCSKPKPSKHQHQSQQTHRRSHNHPSPLQQQTDAQPSTPLTFFEHPICVGISQSFAQCFRQFQNVLQVYIQDAFQLLDFLTIRLGLCIIVLLCFFAFQMSIDFAALDSDTATALHDTSVYVPSTFVQFSSIPQHQFHSLPFIHAVNFEHEPVCRPEDVVSVSDQFSPYISDHPSSTNHSNPSQDDFAVHLNIFQYIPVLPMASLILAWGFCFTVIQTFPRRIY